MIKQTYILFIFLITACGQTNSSSNQNSNDSADSISKTNKTNFITSSDTSIQFLWRADKYDEALNDTVNTIIINDNYCKTISAPEKAALGFVATFIGNDCWWDGKTQEDRSNLKCKILTALNLGYQCSDTHLGFLRQWFKNDKQALIELENCPTTPYTATIQDTFDEIVLTKRGNVISVWYSASSVNIREGDNWSWTETDYFQIDNDNIRLVKKDQSKVKHEHFDVGE